MQVAGGHFDVTAQTLDCAGDLKRLSYRAAQVLKRLYEAQGAPVSRAELISHAWPGQLPTDVALSQVIVELRRALDDSARQPQWLLTVPRVGYRLVTVAAAAREHVRSQSDPGDAQPGPTPEPVASAPIATSAVRRESAGRPSVWLSLMILAAVLLAIVVLWQGGRDRMNSLRSGSDSPIMVANSPLRERQPALSKDARQLAYIAGNGAVDEVYVVDLESRSAPRKMTSGAVDRWPRWRRDGRELAFMRLIPGTRMSQLRLIDLGGGESRLLTELSMYGSMDWSPRGDSVLVAIPDASGRVRPHWVRTEDARLTPFFEQLWRDEEDWVGDPVYAPGTPQVALRVGRPPTSQLLLVDLQKGERRYLSPASLPIGGFAWSDDGHLIVSAQLQGRDGLWLLDIATASWQFLREDNTVRVDSASGWLVQHKLVSTTGLIGFSLGGDDNAEPLATPGVNNYQPRFSASEGAIVFVSTRNGREELMRMAPGSGEKSITLLRDMTLLDFEVDRDGDDIVLIGSGTAGPSVWLLPANGQMTLWPGTERFGDLRALVFAAEPGELLILATDREGIEGLFRLQADGKSKLLVRESDLDDLQINEKGQVFVARSRSPGFYAVDLTSGGLSLVAAVPFEQLTPWHASVDGILHVGIAEPVPGEPGWYLSRYPLDGSERRLLRRWPDGVQPGSFDVLGDRIITRTFTTNDLDLELQKIPAPSP